MRRIPTCVLSIWQCALGLAGIISGVINLYNFLKIFSIMSDSSVTNCESHSSSCLECLKAFCSYVQVKGSPTFECIGDSFEGFISRFIPPGDYAACEAEFTPAPHIVSTPVIDNSAWIKTGAVALCIIAITMVCCGIAWVGRCARKDKQRKGYSVSLTKEVRRIEEEEVENINMQDFLDRQDQLPLKGNYTEK